MKRLDQGTINTICNALRVAAEVYEEDYNSTSGMERVSSQFKRQHDEAKALSEQLQQADYIEIGTGNPAECGADIDAIHRLRPASEWHDDDGAVIWWQLPVCEPPVIGSGPGSGECDSDGEPTTCVRLLEAGLLTHWSPLPKVQLMEASDGTKVHD